MKNFNWNEKLSMICQICEEEMWHYVSASRYDCKDCNYSISYSRQHMEVNFVESNIEGIWFTLYKDDDKNKNLLEMLSEIKRIAKMAIESGEYGHIRQSNNYCGLTIAVNDYEWRLANKELCLKRTEEAISKLIAKSSFLRTQ